MTEKQFNIFQHLSTKGQKSVPHLSKEIGIPRTQTYAMLKALRTKGAVKIKQNKPFKFEAVSIEEFLEKRILLEYKKLKELEKILAMVNKGQNPNNLD